MWKKALATIFAKTNLKNIIISKATLRHFEQGCEVEFQILNKVINAKT